MLYSYGSGVATSLFTVKILPNFKKQNLINSILIRNTFKNRTICSI